MTDEIHPDGLPTPRRHLAVLAIAIGIAMAVLDGTVVNVALPSIAGEIGASPSAAVWVINAYQLVIVALLLPLASLGERIGYRRIYRVGILVFTLGSLACALSTSLPTLVAARIVQGIGGAAIMSMNGALVRHTYPDARLGRGLGLNGLVVAISAAVAPSLASAILAVGTWPWLFAVNVPFGLLNFWLTRYLPRAEAHDRPFDWGSAVLSAAMFAPVLRRSRCPGPRRRGAAGGRRAWPPPWWRGWCSSGAPAGRRPRSFRSTCSAIRCSRFPWWRRSAPSPPSPSPSWRCRSTSSRCSGATRSRPGS